jgi:hypothetical protein
MRHESITTTLDAYGHLMPSLDDKLTDGLDNLYWEARNSANVAYLWRERSNRLTDEDTRVEEKSL